MGLKRSLWRDDKFFIHLHICPLHTLPSHREYSIYTKIKPFWLPNNLSWVNNILGKTLENISNMVCCTLLSFFCKPCWSPNIILCKRPMLCSELMWFHLGGLQRQEKVFLWLLWCNRSLLEQTPSHQAWSVRTWERACHRFRLPQGFSCWLHSPTLLKASRSSAISSSEKCAVDAISYFSEWQVCKKKTLVFIWCFLGLQLWWNREVFTWVFKVLKQLAIAEKAAPLCILKSSEEIKFCVDEMQFCVPPVVSPNPAQNSNSFIYTNLTGIKSYLC